MKNSNKGFFCFFGGIVYYIPPLKTFKGDKNENY